MASAKQPSLTVARGGASILALALLAAATAGQQDAPRFDPARTAPLDVARVMAARYPSAPSMSYIPALAWSGALRLSVLAGDPQWGEKAKREMAPFLSGEKPAIATPYQLASLGGHIAFADLALMERHAVAGDLARKAADLIVPSSGEDVVSFASRWTDDMYMAGALLARVAALTGQEVYARAAVRLLTSYADRLQRPDGLFIHAAGGPHAWGRGNGFAALGLADALTYLPAGTPDRARVLDVYRTHMKGLLTHQSDDGAWRQVVDDPASYRELTVTALTLSAMARGVRLSWLDRSFVPAIDRAWTAVLARVGTDGTLRDVCASTGAGPTKEHYLTRPIVNGADDRGGGMVLLAALEIAELRRR
jgi:rhamnogalacturonyl hydrolase YesR